MLTQERVRTTVDAAEKVFLRCLAILCKIKDRSNDRQDLLEFQPQLASALFELDSLYGEAARERKGLIRRKSSFSPNWFKRRLSILARYQLILSISAKRGRVLGDNFAWLFYCRDELWLHEHLEHEAVTHISSGVGGFAEVAFVRQFPLIDNRFLVIYHGNTTFLRIGDVSLIDITDFRVAALGELKAGPVENGQVKIGLYLVATRAIFDTLNISDQTMDWDRFKNSKRQVERMTATVTTPMPKDLHHLRLSVDYSGLKAAFNEARRSGFAFRQLGPSLAILVAASPSSPSSHLRWRRSLPRKIESQLAAITPRLAQLASEPLEDNGFWIGSLTLNYLPGTTPLFWATPTEIFKDLFCERIVATTFYNPARFIRYLRRFGLQVEYLPHRAGLSIIQTTGNKRVELQNGDYFLRLIQDYLVNELQVAEFVANLFGLSERFGHGTDLELIPMQLHVKSNST